MKRLSGSAVGRLVTRRDAIGASAITVAGLVLGHPTNRLTAQPPGRLKQSASRWCYRSIALPDLIAMFGNRQGRSDEQATQACVTGLRRIAPTAERHGVTICVELLNSKVDHKDYQGDRTAFGANIIEAVGSPRVKLLYDIYHMQIMEGDVIRTIRQHAAHIGHFHTGGVPGRHELDDTQELNYHAIARDIADTGFTGFVAHEFVPTRDPLTSLKQGVEVCSV